MQWSVRWKTVIKAFDGGHFKMAAILSVIMKQRWKFRFNGFLNMDIGTKNSQCSEFWDSKLWYVAIQGGHFENGRNFVRHFEILLDSDIFRNSWVFWASMPKFMLVSQNARFFMENWLNLPS